MSEQEKLKALIERAENNDNDFDVTEIIPSLSPYTGTIDTSLTGMIWLSRYAIIFNHHLVRALFPDIDQKCPYCHVRMFSKLRHYSFCPYSLVISELPLWQHHLQQAVVSDDPIDYLYHAAVFGGEQ